MNKLSTILNNAAEYNLASIYLPDSSLEESEYSCLAVGRAAEDYFKSINSWAYIWEASVYFENTIMPFLKSLGLILHYDDERDEGEFNEFPKGPDRQSARYCWLKFAAMIAEEEGL